MKPIGYSRQAIDESDIAAVVDVLRSDFLTQGPAVPRFEEAFAAEHKAAHAVAVANATVALHLACLALGVESGDIVWTSPISYVASANCARYCGAEVDFVDIDPRTRNMSVDALSAKLADAAAAGRLPKVVIPVDFSGLPCDLEDMRELADRYGFAIVEDASHAVGASYRGSPVGGGLADITVFSFHPVKIITTGEGGICLTQDARLADRLRLLRSHGVTRDAALLTRESDGPWYYEQVALGMNYRLTDIQAALGSSQLARLGQLHARREMLAARYDERLRDLPLKLPVRLNDRASSHHLYVVEVGDGTSGEPRRALYDGLRARNIEPNVHYIPIHLQPYYRELGHAPGDFPHAEAYYRGALSIPLFPSLIEDQQDEVITALTELLG